MIQFGAVEIPIGVPAADRTLDILARIDARAQQMGVSTAAAYDKTAVSSVAATRGMSAFSALQAEAAGHVGAHSLALGRLERVMSSAVGETAGVNRIVELLATSMGKFALGSIEMVAILAGVYAVSYAWKAFTKDAEAAEKATDDAIKRLEELATKQRQGKFGTTPGDLNQQIMAMQDANKRVADAQAKVDQSLADFRKVQQMGLSTRSDADLLKYYVPANLKNELSKAINERTKLERDGQAAHAFIAETQKKSDEEAAKDRDKQTNDGVRALDSRYSLYRAEAKKSLDAELVVQDDYIDELKKKYPKANEALQQALVARQEILNRMDAEERSQQQRINADMDADRRTERERALAEAKWYADEDARIAEHAAQLELERQRRVQAGAEQMAQRIGSVVTSTFQGLASGGVIGGLKAFGESVLKGIGEILVQIGERMIAAAPIIQLISAALLGLNAAALLGGGIALVALGASMGAIANRGGGGSAGSASASPVDYSRSITATVSSVYTPNTAGVRAQSPVVVNATFIGKHDPKGQRELLEMITTAQRRVV